MTVSATEEAIIIGSGPAGLTAALYAARANLQPLVFEGVQPQGQLMLTTKVENYPGFPQGVTGPDLMSAFREQATGFRARFVTKDVTRVDLSPRPFKVCVGEETYLAEALIIATGARAKMLGVAGEREFMGYGVSTCATCDGFFFSGEDVVVIGGGDSAMEEATFLTRFAARVTIVHRRDRLRASKVMQERAFANPKIDFVWNSVVTQVQGSDGAVQGIQISDVLTGDSTVLPARGVFLGIGHEPNTELFRGQLKLNSDGYIEVGHPRTQTSVEGVFACGDAVDHIYRQAVTAAGTGCAAAIDLERFLESQASFVGQLA